MQRQFVIRNEQRTLRLVAADETEALAWVRVLLRCIAEVSTKEQVHERTESLRANRTNVLGMPHAVDSVDELILLFLPRRAAGQTGAARHDSSTLGNADRLAYGANTAEETLPSPPRAGAISADGSAAASSSPSSSPSSSLSAAQEEMLSVIILTIHTYGVSLADVASRLLSLYDGEPAVSVAAPTPEAQSTPPRARSPFTKLTQRRISYLLLRWAQLHPHHFAAVDNDHLRQIWQRAASDGYLAELGLRIAYKYSTLDANAKAADPQAVGASANASDAACAGTSAVAPHLRQPRQIVRKRSSLAAELNGFGDVERLSACSLSEADGCQLGRVSICGNACSSPDTQSEAGPSSLPRTAHESVTDDVAGNSLPLLPADTGAWLPFMRPQRAGYALAGVRETPISQLTAHEAQQILLCIAPGLAQLNAASKRSSLPNPANLARLATAEVGRTGRSSLKAVAAAGSAAVGRRRSTQHITREPADSRAQHQADVVGQRRLPKGVAERVHAVLSRPVSTDMVCAEQWLTVEPQQLARYLTLADERLYHCVGHAHLLSYVWTTRADGPSSSKQPLQQLTQRFNEVASVVATAIISTSRLNTRALLLAHFIAVGT